MKFKTKPYKHQKLAFELSKNRPAFALLMEQGTGKSKVLIDTAAWLYQQGEITLVIVVAPNGVHDNWTRNEIPVHMALPESLWRAATWRSSMLAKERKQLDYVFEPGYPGLRLVSINVEAFSHKKAPAFVKAHLLHSQALLIVDESTTIKTPSSKRTRTLMNLASKFAYVRIATGTPITQGPLDLYAQFKLLGCPILGLPTFQSFKHKFAEWETKINHTQGREYKELIRYRNLDVLSREVKKDSFRILKVDCLDLPLKIYERVYVDMEPEQAKAYNAVSNQIRSELGSGVITTNLAITRLIRLHQIACGVLVTDDDEIHLLDGLIKRINATRQIIEESGGKVIIWTRFVAPIEPLRRALSADLGEDRVWAYYGAIKPSERAEALEAFKESEGRAALIVQSRAGGYGLTLTSASTVIYFSNDFSLEVRLQSEDRCHRIGQHYPVTYFDLECPGTIDSKVIGALRDKRDIAAQITQDNVGEWL